MPGGPISAAVGYQSRNDKYSKTYFGRGTCRRHLDRQRNRERASSGARTFDAMFIELAVPVLDNLELELAVRREEFSTGQTSTDPKYGVTYAPLDWLTLRATAGDAFIAPTLSNY